MTKPQAIQDAKDRTKKNQLVWHAIRIRTKRFLWFFSKYTYDTVSEHHLSTHTKQYESGKFKSVYICSPELETELELDNYSINEHLK